MKIETTKVTKMAITDVPNLDPIYVFLDDIAPRTGRITITCWTESWTAWWGGMGEQTIAEFFYSCDEHYLAKNLSSIPGDIEDTDAIEAAAKKSIIKSRKDKDINADEARDLWDELDSVDWEHAHNNPSLMHKIFGEEWWYAIPTKPNPKYRYLCRIIKAVQKAIQQTIQQPA